MVQCADLHCPILLSHCLHSDLLEQTAADKILEFCIQVCSFEHPSPGDVGQHLPERIILLYCLLVRGIDELKATHFVPLVGVQVLDGQPLSNLQPNRLDPQSYVSRTVPP